MYTIIFSSIPDPFDIVSGPAEVKVKGQDQLQGKIMHKHNKIRQ